MTMPTIPRIFATAALCLAAMGLSACSWCWPSLHTAEAVLHCDRQVVVNILEPPSFKYRYKGLDWRPIKLAYAIDKGKNIYRRGDGVVWCIQDNSDRYQILQESVRTFMIPCDTPQHTRMNEGSCYEQAIAEQDFPFSKATRIKIDEVENRPSAFLSSSGVCAPYLEVGSAVASMPISSPHPQPSIGQRLAAVPLEVVDATATIAMRATEVAVIIVLLPPSAVWNGIAKLING